MKLALEWGGDQNGFAMKRFFYLFPLLGLLGNAWAGTALKAHLQSYSYKKAWVDVEVAIADGRLRVDFEGPISSGSLLYDRDSSIVTLVDHLHKTILPLSPTDQTAIKLLLAVNASQLKGRVAGSRISAQNAFDIAEENAKAFFNGTPELRERGVKRGGFACDLYVTRLEHLGKVREAWVTTPEEAGMKGEDYNTFRSLAHLALDLSTDQLEAFGADTGPFEQNLTQNVFPIEEVLYAKGKPSADFKILSLHPADFPPGEFDPPASYTVMGLVDLLRQGRN